MLWRTVGSAKPLAARSTSEPEPRSSDERHGAAGAERDQFRERRLFGEAGNFEIRRVHAQQRAGVFVDGPFVVAQAGTIGGADFAQDRAALRHDFGDAKAVADFDQFAPRDDGFAALGERSKHQKDCGGAVVHHDGVFRAGEAGEQFGGVGVALAACPGCQVVFEIAVLRGGISDRVSDGRRKRSAPEIGVQNYAGGVDERLKRRMQDAVSFGGD